MVASGTAIMAVPCRESKRGRLDEDFFLFEELAEGLHRYVRECRCKCSILGRKVQIVYSVHPRNEALVYSPLVREADFYDFQLLQVELGLGKRTKTPLNRPSPYTPFSIRW